jgi:hypothetical protein
MWADCVIVTGKTCRPDATVLHYSTALHGGLLVGEVGRSYNQTRWGYASDRTQRGRIDKIGCARRHQHYHYTTSAFNALDTA